MIVAAKALPYLSMLNLVKCQVDLLDKNSFICIAPPELLTATEDLVWPGDSEHWMNSFFEDVRPEHLAELPELERQLGRKVEVFDEQKADRIIDFLLTANARPESETLYVNCTAGVSRSGALASFAAEIFEIDRKQFKQDNPRIMPNGLVLYLLRERFHLRNSSGKAGRAVVQQWVSTN